MNVDGSARELRDGSAPRRPGMASPPARGRWLVLGAAVLMQLCLGATYAWPAFVGPLRGLTGLGQGPAQVPFTVFYMVFPAMVTVAGGLLARLGPRRMALAGGLLFGAGWMLAGLGRVHFAFTLAGIGVIGGIGVGFAYLVPIATAILWFPERKGLVTGVAVGGFGGGAALVAQSAEALMARGLTPYQAFPLFGAAFALLIGLASLAMRRPATDNSAQSSPPAQAEPTLATGAERREFWWLFAAMTAGLAAGFTVNGNLKQLAAGASGAAESGASAVAGGLGGLGVVALFALANALGRVGWGWAFDGAPARRMLKLNLAAQGALLLAAPLLLRPGLLPGSFGPALLALAAGFNYGGVLVLYAGTVARRWGAGRVGPVYGRLFAANIPASLAPLAAGMAFDRWASFTPALLALGVLTLAATAAVNLATKEHERTRNEELDLH